LGCEPGGHRVDLGVGVSLGDLVHNSRGPLAVAEGAHLRRDVLARQPGERNEILRNRLAVGTVADGAA
jgi:hypothetical protein